MSVEGSCRCGQGERSFEVAVRKGTTEQVMFKPTAGDGWYYGVWMERTGTW
jgi:hypothetical protein